MPEADTAEKAKARGKAAARRMFEEQQSARKRREEEERNKPDNAAIALIIALSGATAFTLFG